MKTIKNVVKEIAIGAVIGSIAGILIGLAVIGSVAILIKVAELVL